MRCGIVLVSINALAHDANNPGISKLKLESEPQMVKSEKKNLIHTDNGVLVLSVQERSRLEEEVKNLRALLDRNQRHSKLQ